MSRVDSRGSAEDRRRRKQYLLDVYGDGSTVKCWLCGLMLTYATLTVDRVVPGAYGGRYIRKNIRPACGPCNSRDGNEIKKQLQKEKRHA